MKVVNSCHPPFHELFLLHSKERKEKLEKEEKERERRIFAYESEDNSKKKN